MNAPRSYELLGTGEGYGQNRWYVVSVSVVPSAAALKTLICEVIRQEKPTNYCILSISVFVDLDKYVPSVGHGDTEIDRIQDEHWVVRYLWNADLPNRRDRIMLVREERFVDFNHVRDCK